jgi:hypothetical protein
MNSFKVAESLAHGTSMTTFTTSGASSPMDRLSRSTFIIFLGCSYFYVFGDYVLTGSFPWPACLTNRSIGASG